jgi:hypothetical protein
MWIWACHSGSRESREVEKFQSTFSSLLRSAVGCRSVSCLGSQIGSSELGDKIIYEKEKLRIEAAEKAFVSGRGKQFQFQLI